MLIGAYVILHLIVWDSSTGTMLESLDRRFSGFQISGNRIEDCRVWGVDYAHKLKEFYEETGLILWDHRAGEPVVRKYPDAFTNVDCEWVRVPGVPL